MWMIWLIAAAVLVIIEVISQSIWTLCLAAGCLGAALADALDVTMVWQIVIMAGVSVAAFPLLLPLFRRWHRRKAPAKEMRTGMEALLGRTGVVVDEICPGKLGRVRIDGDRWQAKVPEANRIIHRGEEVSVVAYDSIILTVEPLNNG